MLVLAAAAAYGLIELPAGVTRLYLNIGSSIDPMMAPDNNFSHTIAVEPISGCTIRERTRDARSGLGGINVIHAAVSDRSGLSTMGVFNVYGVSSSLASPAQKHEKWADQPPKLVPVVSMTTILDSLPPPPLELWYLKTDMQGFDFTAVGSAEPRLLRRAHYLNTEVYLGGVATYEGVSNDYCSQWLPFMLSQGFVPVGLQQETPRPKRQLLGLEALPPNSSAAEYLSRAHSFCAWMQKKQEALRDRKDNAHFPSPWEADAIWVRNDTWLPEPPNVKNFHWPVYRGLKNKKLPSR